MLIFEKLFITWKGLYIHKIMINQCSPLVFAYFATTMLAVCTRIEVLSGRRSRGERERKREREREENKETDRYIHTK